MARSDAATPDAVETAGEERRESFPQIHKRIMHTFGVLNKVAQGVIGGHIRASVVSGAAGCGKTYTMEKALKRAQSDGLIAYESVRGSMSAIGLYRELWRASGEYRPMGGSGEEDEESGEDTNYGDGKHHVLLIDDCDSIFADLDALNLLKAALDTTKTRRVHWNKESRVLDEEGVPRNFEFNGAVVFITNIDFQSEIDADKKMSPHYAALMSRCMYVDLGIHTKREIFVRISQVVFSKEFLKESGLKTEQAKEMMEWLRLHVDRVRTLSIRTILQLASLVKTDPDWQAMAEVIMLKKASRLG